MKANQIAKRGMFVAAILTAVLLIAGCSQFFAPAASSSQLPNGYCPTADEIAAIKALTPQAEQIRAKVAGSRSIGELGAEDTKALLDSYIALLKTQFGADYKKFVLVRKASVTVNIETNEIIASEPARYIDPETADTPVPLARDFVDPDLGHGYILRCEAWQIALPWQGWNNAKSTLKVWNGSSFTNVDASTINVRLFDARSDLTRANTNVSWVDVAGNGKGGWFPHFSCHTQHEVWYPPITGGYSGLKGTYDWF